MFRVCTILGINVDGLIWPIGLILGLLTLKLTLSNQACKLLGASPPQPIKIVKKHVSIHMELELYNIFIGSTLKKQLKF